MTGSCLWLRLVKLAFCDFQWVETEDSLVQLIFTLSCIFIFNGIHSGMGRHNAAITDGDDQATALMVRLLFFPPLCSRRLLQTLYIIMSLFLTLVLVASIGGGLLHTQYDVH